MKEESSEEEIVWSTFVVAMLASLAYALFITWGLGRRRGSTTAVASAVYVFLILVFATWAVAAWIGARGPIMWDAPWLMIVVVGALLALIVIATMTERRASKGKLDVPGDNPVPSIAMGFGFGSLFWLMIVGLFIATLIGIAATERPVEHEVPAVR